MNVLRDTVLVTLSSCSLLPNNLSTVPSTSTTDSKLQESGKNVFATVHRSKACLASTRLNDIRDSGDIKPPPGHIGNLLDFKEHLCLDSGARPSTALITQAAFVDIGRQNFLVITSYRGIQVSLFSYVWRLPNYFIILRQSIRKKCWSSFRCTETVKWSFGML